MQYLFTLVASSDPALSDEELQQITSALSEVEAGENEGLSWQVNTNPTIGFYRALHTHLKKQPGVTKVLIGRFYIAVDHNIRERGSRPDNVYRYIENVTSSSRHSDQPMVYYIHGIKQMGSQLKKCSEKLEKLNAECIELRQRFEVSREQLKMAKLALHAANEKNVSLNRQCMITKHRCDELKIKNAFLETEYAQIQSQNFDLLDDSTEDTSSDVSFTNESAESHLQSIIGHRKYSPEIRKLYYKLLAEQVPVSNITDIIRSVLRCFHPAVDVDRLRLPQKTCASYMRCEELNTICNAHKASMLCTDSVRAKGVSLNTDGTTKSQKKLGGVVANNVVLSVNELPDGTALSAIEDISREFEKLRKAAKELGLPNPNSINWSLVVSSSSDSAATQKRVNKLIEECRYNDEEKYGPATVETIELIETFCSMHLGVNLRKAFLSGVLESGDEDTAPGERRYHRVDTFVHEFCKLFGKTGAPEYACGVVSFPDFLELKVSSSRGSELSYYQSCLKVRLHRQIGSRYFVTASNACKVLFLKDAAIAFLTFTGKNFGNKLERDVFAKLQDAMELAHLMADSLMYYHVYGDLYMLSKSNDLGSTVLSMSYHYLELRTYLSEVEKSPEVALDPRYQVFRSETRLYDLQSQSNHRLQSAGIYQKLFEEAKTDNEILTSLLVKGASSMKEKLQSYAKDQLPGGRYWDPDENVKRVLCQLRPSNDVCESILGLNDYLTTAIPNLHQMSRSNLVQVKRNKTLKWLADLPDEEQQAVVKMAVKQRRLVHEEYKEEERKRAEQRREAMVRENAKRVAQKEKLCQEKEKLSQLHLIITSKELREELAKIDSEDMTATKKRSKKSALLKTQVQIRRKILHQSVPIVFTSNRKQRPLANIVTELCDFIENSTLPAEYSSFLTDPSFLVGRRIKQQFQDGESGATTWYCGTVLDYCVSKKTHSIVYDGDDNQYHYDLAIDLLNGDLIVVD